MLHFVLLELKSVFFLFSNAVLLFSHLSTTLVMFSPELQDAVEEILPDLLQQQVTVFILADRCKSAQTHSLKDKVRQASAEPLAREHRSHLNMGSAAVYIYTSGTTGEPLSLLGCHWLTSLALKLTTSRPPPTAGLPKAAEVSHGKVWAMSSLMSVTGVKPWDVLYTSLPLYHSAGFLCFTSAIERGTLTLRNTK